MNQVGPEEARDMLQGVDDVTSRTKKMIAYAGGDVIFIVWGVVWFLGGLSSHLTPIFANGNPVRGLFPGIVWTVLVAAGIIVSCRVARNSTPTKNTMGKSIGMLWWFLYMYVGMWLTLLMPFVKIDGPREFHLFWTHMGAIAATVPLFMYVVFGLFLDRYMLYIGLGMTALMAIGVFVFEPWFYLWMAFVGGGGLAGTGLMVRKLWKQP